MSFNGFVSHMDLAQVVLYIFWLFFARLIYYLIQENKREGYPLTPDVADRSHGPWIGFPPLPSDRVYLKTHGGTYTTPNASGDDRPIALVPTARFPGAPLEPTGNPLVDGVGPASYALRADTPDRGWEGENTLAPLRIAPDHGVATRDPDPRGMKVLGTDGRIAGTIVDAWVDRAELLFRYYEVALEGSGRHVMLPVNFCRVDGTKRLITVKAITAAQFADVPGLANPDQVTLLEEDKICGYFGGGYLYATLARAEPLL